MGVSFVALALALFLLSVAPYRPFLSFCPLLFLCPLVGVVRCYRVSASCCCLCREGGFGVNGFVWRRCLCLLSCSPCFKRRPTGASLCRACLLLLLSPPLGPCGCFCSCLFYGARACVAVATLQARLICPLATQPC